MTKKTFILTFDYDETKIEDTSQFNEVLGISDERAHYLIDLAEMDAIAQNVGTEEKPFNSAKALIDLLDFGVLNGNDILFYIFGGYTMSLKMNMVREQTKNQVLHTLLGGIL